MTTQLALLDTTSPCADQRSRNHAQRVTPPECLDLLCALPEFRARSGEAVDLGCGDAATIARGVHEQLPRGSKGHVKAWLLLDKRADAIEVSKAWTPRVPVVRAVCDVLEPGWAVDYGVHSIGRIVSNPPWSVLRCKVCGYTWPARDRGTNCVTCGGDGQDLAILMVRAAMHECRRADVWVLHNSNWPFHAQRARFWGSEAPRTHRYAGRHELSGIRVAYADPASDAKVQPHNRPAVWYHWVPTRRFKEQRVTHNEWPLFLTENGARV